MFDHEGKGTTRARVRCKGCGSTRVSGIVAAYVDGRLVVDQAGRVGVEDGETVIHDEHWIEPGSVVCQNCGGVEYRVERDRQVVSGG